MKDPAKIIVLSGATKGLGRAMVRLLAEMGHTILGCGRSTRAIEELRNQFPAPHRWEVVDITRMEEVNKWARQSIDAFGGPDYLINNAAIINTPAPSWIVSEQEWKEIFDINVLGTVRMIRAWVPAMVRAKKGIIVNFSSTWGRTTSPDVAPYCASKFAIEGLTQSLAQEIPKTMAAVALNPGIINTNMLAKCFGEGANSYQSPQDWARKAVPFLMKIGPAQNGKTVSVG